jgi:hypothetical protein
MTGPLSQRRTRRGLWLVGLSGLSLASCAARPPARIESAPSSTEARGAPEPDASSPSRSDPTEARTFGWLSLAVGTESAIVATVTSVMMLHDKSTRDSGCNAEKVCFPSGFDANTQIGALEVWNAGSWVLAAAGLGLGTYLIATHPLERHVPLSVNASPGGISVAGTF